MSSKKVKEEVQTQGEQASNEQAKPNALLIKAELVEALVSYLLDRKMSEVEGLVNGLRKSRAVAVSEKESQA